jgi:hypothetical protein
MYSTLNWSCSAVIIFSMSGWGATNNMKAASDEVNARIDRTCSCDDLVDTRMRAPNHDDQSIGDVDGERQFALRGPLQPKTCGVAKTVMFSTPPLTIRPNLTQTVSFPFTIPKTAYAGTYTITATTFPKGVAVDTSTASLAVAAH